MKKFERLEALPASGPIYIPAGGGAASYSEGFVVRFYKSDGTTWIGNFNPRSSDLEYIGELENNLLIVVAWGHCYIMNPDNRVAPRPNTNF